MQCPGWRSDRLRHDGLRWRDLQLREPAVLRLDQARLCSTNQSWASPTPLTPVVTGQWPPTGESSPTMPHSSARWRQAPQRTDCGNRRRPGNRWLLGGGLRRGIFAYDAPFLGSMEVSTSTHRLWESPKTRQPVATGRWLPRGSSPTMPHSWLDGRQATQRTDCGNRRRPGNRWLLGGGLRRGVFAYDAPFFGSMGRAPLNKHRLWNRRNGNRWLLGGGFRRGDLRLRCPFLGSMGGKHLNAPVVGISGVLAENMSTITRPSVTRSPTA